jgi:hypothetical protein
MIAAWMVAYLVFGALFFVVAACAERVAKRIGWPTRWVWLAAMVAMLVAPVVPRPVPGRLAFTATTFAAVDERAVARTRERIRGDARAGAGDESSGVPGTIGNTRALQRRSGIGTPLPPDARVEITMGRVTGNAVVLAANDRLAWAGRVAAVAWCALTVVALALVGLAIGRLARARREWTRADEATHAVIAEAAGRSVPVSMSRATGPAAFGLGELQVVLPAWVGELPDGERTLLLAHEAAHIRAHDPRLLAAALLPVALAPWHVPLLVAYRRLCRAVEHDCDARVLARHGDARAYGRLLVHTAEWLLAGRGAWRGGLAARWILAPVPAFAASPTELEGRLRALVRRPASWGTRLGTLCVGAIGVVALLAACAAPSPTTGSSRITYGVSSLPRTLRDSMRLYDRVNDLRMRSRLEAVRDSLIDAAALQAIPALDTLAGVDSLSIWVLLDDDLRAVATRVAPRHQFLWAMERVVPGFGRDTYTVATRGTPDAALAANVNSWSRAFPLLDPDRVNQHGARELRLPQGTLTVQWARLYAGDSTSTMRLRAAGEPPRVPAWYRTVVEAVSRDGAVARRDFAAALDRGLRASLASRYPEALDTIATRGESFVWLVLGPTGNAVAHATGRAGMGVKRPRTSDATPLARAVPTTPESQLTIDDAAWRAKFPTLNLTPASFGWTSFLVGTRTVNVLWVLTDVSLAGGSRTAPAAGAPGATPALVADTVLAMAQALPTAPALAATPALATTPARAATPALPAAHAPAAAQAVDARRADSLIADAYVDAHAAQSARVERLRRSVRRALSAREAANMDRLLRSTIVTARPELLRGRRTDADFVWLVFDSTGQVVASDTGRAGLGVKVDGWRGELLPLPRATDVTARDSLVLDPRAFRTKFAGRVHRGSGYTWQGLTLPNGQINVLWTVAARD